MVRSSRPLVLAVLVCMASVANEQEQLSVATVTVGAPSPDSPGRLIRSRFATGSPASAAPQAKSVALSGNFLAAPRAASRLGDRWSLELPLSEGRYIWQWRVDDTAPPEDSIFTDIASKPRRSGTRSGLLLVRALQRVPAALP